MDNTELELLVMKLIMNSGNSKSLSMEAIQCAKNNQMDLAKAKIEEAEESLNLAHEVQTEMLVKEARGNTLAFSLLLTHSQDHLMNSICTLDLAKEMISLWDALHKK